MGRKKSLSSMTCSELVEEEGTINNTHKRSIIIQVDGGLNEYLAELHIDDISNIQSAVFAADPESA